VSQQLGLSFLLLSAPEGLFRFYQLFVDKSIISEKELLVNTFLVTNW
jgi:hypothetical protein